MMIEDKQPRIYVIVPGYGPFDDYYQNIFLPAIQATGCRAVEPREMDGTGPITNKVAAEIREACALVVEVSDGFDHIKYELGFAHALRKPVVMISKTPRELPKNYDHIWDVSYDVEKRGWDQRLSEDLIETLQSILKQRDQPTDIASPSEIRCIYKNRSEVPLTNLLRAAEPGSEINILGIALTDLSTATMRDAVQQKLSGGCHFRILWLNPESPYGRVRGGGGKFTN